MSRVIQIRRGTSAEHANFTGAAGEITMDTTNNTLRVHDGETAGGTILAKQSEIPAPYTMPENYDFVVECQLPTAANNYTWYRKYKSGWVEMGGILSVGSISLGSGAATTVANVVFLLEISKIICVSFGQTMQYFTTNFRDGSGTGFNVVVSNSLPVSNTENNCVITWEVQGVTVE